MNQTQISVVQSVLQQLTHLRGSMTIAEQAVLDSIVTSEVAAHAMDERPFAGAAQTKSGMVEKPFAGAADEVAAHAMDERPFTGAAQTRSVTFERPQTGAADEVAAHAMDERPFTGAAQTRSVTYQISLDAATQAYQLAVQS